MARIPNVLLLALAAAAPVAAQEERPFPNFRVDLSFGAGNAEHSTDGSNLSGDTDAAFFRIQFEGISDGGFGGGLRIEGWQSDDDLFDGAGFPGTESRTSSLFGHFSFLVAEGKFRMPLRAGLVFQGHLLDDATTGEEVTFSSVGPQFEVAPELFFTNKSKFKWSVYSELGFAFAGTVVEVDNYPGDFDSATWMYGFELGTRLYWRHFEFGLAYVSRGHTMDESDPNGTDVVFGYDASFDGLLFTVGAIF